MVHWFSEEIIKCKENISDFDFSLLALCYVQNILSNLFKKAKKKSKNPIWQSKFLYFTINISPEDRKSWRQLLKVTKTLKKEEQKKARGRGGGMVSREEVIYILWHCFSVYFLSILFFRDIFLYKRW